MGDGDGVEYVVVEGGVVNRDKAVVLCVVEGAVVLGGVVEFGVDDVVLVVVVEAGVADGGVGGVEGDAVVVIEGVVVVVMDFGTVLQGREKGKVINANVSGLF